MDLAHLLERGLFMAINKANLSQKSAVVKTSFPPIQPQSKFLTGNYWIYKFKIKSLGGSETYLQGSYYGGTDDLFVRSKIGSLLCQYGPFDSAVVVRIVVPVDDENPSVVELH